ncbi:MAG: PIG-L family deacetylase [Ruminococcaceae bacterium]|nr:PIG-L family deacetylase [Oscillospiraceae bacterium]
MSLKLNENAEIYVFDGVSEDEAFARTTCMGVSAHQDDIELMCWAGILDCFGKKDKWFSAVVVTDGAGSPRTGLYSDYTDEEMMAVRRLEQKKAAFVGEYGSLAMLNYSSREVKTPENEAVCEDLKNLILSARPEVIFTHNLADKHDTHVAVAVKLINAIRRLPKADRPKKLYGGEVWRSLDWVNDSEKTVFDVTAHQNMAASLVSLFDSQVAGGKRYDLATQGRRTANATYFESHGTDNAESLMYAIDMTPLIEDDSLDIAEFINKYIDSFKNDVNDRIKKMI